MILQRRKLVALEAGLSLRGGRSSTTGKCRRSFIRSPLRRRKSLQWLLSRIPILCPYAFPAISAGHGLSWPSTKRPFYLGAPKILNCPGEAESLPKRPHTPLTSHSGMVVFDYTRYLVEDILLDKRRAYHFCIVSQKQRYINIC